MSARTRILYGSRVCPSCSGIGYPNPAKPTLACTSCGGDGVIPAFGRCFTEDERQALCLAGRALREVGAGLRRTGNDELAIESVRNADVLDALLLTAVVGAASEHSAEVEAER